MDKDSLNAKRVQRIEELRRDLSHTDKTRSAYALRTLLSMLWLEEPNAQSAIACALSGYPPLLEDEASPAFAVRLCEQLPATSSVEIPSLPLDDARILEWAKRATTAILRTSLHKIRAMMTTPESTDIDALYQETDVCRDALTMAKHIRLDTIVEEAVKILRLFPPDQARGSGPLGRQTTPLRNGAASLLGEISPDRLYAFWYALGSPDRTARRDLLTVLDYMEDARAIPYLVRLLERRGQWEDGEMVGWFVVRAFHRLRDRRALNPLRRLAAEAGSKAHANLSRSGLGAPAGPELAREAKRAIEAIEYGRDRGSRQELLRPSQSPAEQLLHPSQRPTDDLLRASDPDASMLLRPSDAGADMLLRPADRSGADLLRPTANTTPPATPHLTPQEPENPFENFHPDLSS